MLEPDFNFNDPIEIIEIFRVQEPDRMIEYGSKSCFLWEDLQLIEESPYPDNWDKYKGEKYHITLRGHPTKLILGSFNSMKIYWSMFRNKYPIFVDRQDDKGGGT